ncbi:MAG: DUF2304 domain-containing protein [Acidimicrobiales bacterium]
MSEGLRQSLLVLVASLACVSITVALKRRQLLTLRYTIGWMSIAGLAGVSAVASRLVTPLSSSLGLTPTGFIFGVATAILLAVALQLSVTVSQLQAQIRDMARSVAIREAEVGRG